jgi:hypothetical protein
VNAVMNFGFYNMRGITWLAAIRLVSQEGLCSCSKWVSSPTEEAIDPSMYGATSPSEPWPPSRGDFIRPCFQLFSSILLSLAAIITSLWTTSAHLVLGFPTGHVLWKFPFKTLFVFLSSYAAIDIVCK